jgi:hypothetical protein
MWNEGIAPSFNISVLDGVEWSTSRPCRFNPAERTPPYLLEKKEVKHPIEKKKNEESKYKKHS